MHDLAKDTDRNAEDSMAYETFHVAYEGSVAVVTLSRPEKRNALAPSFWSDFPAAIRRLSERGKARVLIIEADGPHFTAGMDVSVFTQSALNVSGSHEREALMGIIEGLQDTFTSLEKARFPVIAAIHGYCLGAGVDLVTACDMRFAAADALFRVEETNIAMAADVGTLQRLPKLISDGVARELAFTGENLDARRAERVGLVNAVLDDVATLKEHVRRVAQTIASKSPLAIAGTKRAMVYARDHSVDDSLAQMRFLQAGIWSTADMAEAFAARGEKRAGSYRDLEPITPFTKARKS